jgi:hypothetical protein
MLRELPDEDATLVLMANLIERRLCMEPFWRLIAAIRVMARFRAHQNRVRLAEKLRDAADYIENIHQHEVASID